MCKTHHTEIHRNLTSGLHSVDGVHPQSAAYKIPAVLSSPLHQYYFWGRTFCCLLSLGNHRPRIGCIFLKMVAKDNLATVPVEPWLQAPNIIVSQKVRPHCQHRYWVRKHNAVKSVFSIHARQRGSYFHVLYLLGNRQHEHKQVL